MEKEKEPIFSAENARYRSLQNQLTTETALIQIGFSTDQGHMEVPLCGKRPSDKTLKELMEMGFSQRRIRDFNGIEIIIIGW